MENLLIADKSKSRGSIKGLQIGKVVKLENDPAGENRILVSIPALGSKIPEIWSRITSLDAGNERGAFFLPEIDDDVIVGFINDNPGDAVVLGMFHSSDKPAPVTARDANNEKGFTTRNKMHLSFHDDTKSIIIDTPAGNSITIDEQSMKIEIKDQNQNKIIMEASGIKIESGGNIDIKAGATLTLNVSSLSLHAAADVRIHGATTKFTSAGITEISGSVVKIN